MKKKEMAKKVLQVLEELYPNPEPPLTHTSAYTLLVAVLLSARCRDAYVNKVTPALFAKADTPQKMIELSIEEIQSIIKSILFAPTKAKAIWNMSKILVEKYNGKVPNSFEALEELPGVGHKTASVVLSQWFHKPAFPVDTHIHRLAKRWGLSQGKNVEKTEKDLKALFPRKEWHKLHIRMIYFGREYCPALRHHINKCPICSLVNN